MTKSPLPRPIGSMKLKTRITALTLLFVGALLLCLAAISAWAFREFSLSTAQEHARTAAELVRVSMTEAMINGGIDKRESFLERLDAIDGLLDARVLRGPGVTQQFGAGLHSEQATDAIESQVMVTGQAYYRLVENAPVFRATIPYVATEQGTPNCLHCHQVEPGAVLGAVTISISIEALQQQALQVLIVMLAVLTGVALLFLLLFRRQLNPVIETAQGVQEVVQRARVGEFSGRIPCQGDDEVAQIAADLNRLMGYLEERLGETCQDVARLMKYELPGNIDLLQTTTEMVAGLVDVSQFKQEIEEDQTTQEVYNRIAHVLLDQFRIRHFSVYETSPTSNRMLPVVVDGQPQTPCRWCDPTVLSTADACRALRTGRIIDSVAHPRLCSRFCNNGQEELQHICLPVVQSGAVRSVVQLVFDGTGSEAIYRSLPLVLVYLRESSSVVEAKRLMEALRETTLRDAMTGLRNRRFLEEYVSTLVASAERRQEKLSVLMMDLDKFKSVNDTYGHEAGDSVLKSLARTLASQVRAADMVIRYGGEEFMVILQESDGADYSGSALAEKIRAAVEAQPIQIPGQVLHKTLSIGVAHFPQDDGDFWQVVKYADAALYQAKETGRNRVVRWSAKIACAN